MDGVRLAVFDCDGTLVDGQSAICDSMEYAFAQADQPAPARNDIRRAVGLSLPQAISNLRPDLERPMRDRIVEAYKDSFRSARTEGRLEEPLYDGMRELLAGLRADGWTLAVATGKSDRGLISCLETHDIRDWFVSLQTADRHPSKPHPAMLEAALFDAGATPADAIMIGDTSFDMEMARGAQVRALGVAWGYHTADELTAYGAQDVAETMDELKAMLA
ncbi:Phosphoglycolate phosphatase [Alteripontixanthobacter maritimus]|uniref:Phosphoglycolate phosphatase n=1 Tax=Alteripontixanthobacter maritimus TaxID=2161824 RepID=A0A369QAG1_9SPHN|nr:HAD-IA family hydrolase [Alteripontixanthobacter maritimus]RDC59268.1 Phosphoglycolate phosphatase [Alteripontixanthobacter maritimus]